MALDPFAREVWSVLTDAGCTCFTDHGQIPLEKLGYATGSGENVEFDIVVLFEDTGILIECTTQKENNREKIQKFIRHSRYLIDCSLPLRSRFRLFKGIHPKFLEKFDKIKNWRLVYLGTSRELIEKDLTPEKFPSSPTLAVLNAEHWQYIKTLSKTIRQFAAYEFYAHIGIPSTKMGVDAPLAKRFLRLEKKRLSNTLNVEADLFTVRFTPEELLPLARVFRYGGLPMVLEAPGAGEETGGQFQRLFIEDKLTKLSSFIGNKAHFAFPTAVTLVLSKDCRIVSDHHFKDGSHEEALLIPNRFASVDVIDGQHRLFAYAHSSIKPSTRKHTEILATAIKFHTTSMKEINRYAAKLFIDINMNQARVKTSLLYLIDFEVLGSTRPQALAAKVLIKCNEKRSGILYDTFAIKPFLTVGARNMRPIPIVTVANELARLTNIELLRNSTDSSQIAKFLGREKVGTKPEDVIKWGQEALERYFGYVKQIFPQDWGNANQTLLFSANYFTAFIKLLRMFITKEMDHSGVRSALVRMKENLLQTLYQGNGTSSLIIFQADKEEIPAKKAGAEKIYQFLLEGLK